MEVQRVESVEGEIGFARAEHVRPDHERPGLLRARNLGPEEISSQEHVRKAADLRACTIRDCAELGFRPDLVEHGFAHADLRRLTDLQVLLERVRGPARVGDEEAAAIRRHLTGRSLRLSDGSHLRFLHITPEGFIMRVAGPDGLAVCGPMTPMNDHDPAVHAHVDQDVFGTPLRQLFRGWAPRVFHHDSPDGANLRSPVFLLNLWIPLEQVTNPLTLMDRSSFDRRAHQLRYGLPTDEFLDRTEDRRVNDIWAVLPDAGQRWYFTSDQGPERAYVFETLSTPHSSFRVPGEVTARIRYGLLDEARTAVREGDEAGLREVTRRDRGAVPPTTRSLRRALDAMDALLDEAHARAAGLARGDGAPHWRARAARAMERVVRKSIEMRGVAIRIPRGWPLGR